MAYSTTDLLASIKRRCLVPTSQLTFLNTDFLAFANEELQMQIVPMMLSMREDYFVAFTDYTITANQANYAVPPRAIGGKLRDVVYLDSAGIQANLSRIQLDELPYFWQSAQTGIPRSFYFQNNDVYLYPTPSTTYGTLRLFYFQRPSDLVTTTDVGTIAGIDTVNKTVTVNAVPSTFLVGTLCDFVKASPGFGTLSIDQAITSIASTTIGFSALPSSLAVGDYLCIATQAPVAQVPVELQPVLAQRVAIKVLEAIGDNQNLQVAQAKLQEMEAHIETLLSNRVEGEPTKITSGGASIGDYFRGGF